MALPAIVDVRRALPEAAIDVAARPSIAPLFAMVPGGQRCRHARERSERHADRLRRRALRCRAAPAELVQHRAIGLARRHSRAVGLSDRFSIAAADAGRVAADARAPGRVLSAPRACARVCERTSTIEPRLELTDSHREAGAALLAEQGWDGRAPLVAVAPGAAFGGAKRWPAASFAALVDGLAGDGVRSVLIGAAADRAAATEVLMAAAGIAGAIEPRGPDGSADAGGVLAAVPRARDERLGRDALRRGARRLPVTAMFGPTGERETHPIGRPTRRAHAIRSGAVPACCANVR